MHRMWFGLLGLIVVAVDQATKLAIVRALDIGESRPVVEGILYLTHVRNPGAAFGLFRGNQGFLAVASLIGVIVFVVILIRHPTPLIGTGSALIAGGALGNLLDRVTRDWPYHGTVVDFLDFRFWPAFNVADACITTGAAILVLAAFIDHRRAATTPEPDLREKRAGPSDEAQEDTPADTGRDGHAEDRDR